jgi:hypothetical protein
MVSSVSNRVKECVSILGALFPERIGQQISAYPAEAGPESIVDRPFITEVSVLQAA